MGGIVFMSLYEETAESITWATKICNVRLDNCCCQQFTYLLMYGRYRYIHINYGPGTFFYFIYFFRGRVQTLRRGPFA